MDSDLQSTFLVAKYAFVALFGLWLLGLRRWPRPWLLVAGAVAFCLFAYATMLWPLERPYAMQPGLDRMFNLAMGATAATGHSIFESYQVGFGDHEPLWRLILRILSFGDPENVLVVYPFLTPAVIGLLALSLYFVPRSEGCDRWELAFVVYSVLLLSSSPSERFGVFQSFWPMTFLLKPNHVLGFVLLPVWIRVFTSASRLVRGIGAGLLLGLLSWVFLLHWAYVIVGVALYPLLARWLKRAPETGRTAIVVGLSVLIAGPYVVFLLFSFPPGDSVVGRQVWESTAAFREGFYNLFSVGYEHGFVFFLSLAGIARMIRRRTSTDLVWLALLLGALAGWVGYLLAFQMRRIIEPEEFYFYARFLLSVAAGIGGYGLLRGAVGRFERFGPFGSRALPLFLLVTLPLSFPYWWNPPRMDRYYRFGLDPVPEEMVELGAWTRAATSPDAVFMASPDTACWIAALAGRRVLLTGSYRAPNDYEARQSLTVRLLATRERRVFREAVGSYRVTHLALDDAYLEPVDAELSDFETLAWLREVYAGGGVRVLEIDAAELRGDREAPLR